MNLIASLCLHLSFILLDSLVFAIVNHSSKFLLALRDFFSLDDTVFTWLSLYLFSLHFFLDSLIDPYHWFSSAILKLNTCEYLSLARMPPTIVFSFACWTFKSLWYLTLGNIQNSTPLYVVLSQWLKVLLNIYLKLSITMPDNFNSLATS